MTPNSRHELRTPIKMILGFCEALLNTTLPDANRADVEAIYRNAQQLDTLIETVTINQAVTDAAESHTPQLLVLDANGAIYELFREYISGYSVIRASSAEEIGQLGEDVAPVAVITSAEDDKLIPLLTQLIKKDIPILTVSIQAPQRQPHYLMKPVQFSDLDALLQRIGIVPHNVLIVDDSHDNVELLRRMLASQPQPPQILKAYSGREALALLDEQTPDLILMDFVLPDMDGMAIHDYLSLDARLAQIPIVFVSAHHLPDILTVSGASKVSLFQMTAVSPLRLAQQIQSLIRACG